MVKDPNALLKPQYSTQLLGVIGCNLIQLWCEEFGRSYGFDAFEEFRCLDNAHPVVFTQLCSHYHQSKLLDKPQAQVSSISVQSSSSETSSSEAKKKVPDTGSDNILGQVWVGITHESICIPANSVKVVQGKTDKIMRCLLCMVESRDVNNLPMGSWSIGP